ncbi:MAG: P-loop containing nucleoside triphosphate hydrolase protein [Linnemannia gamsii]|nr:MAG: P-loop containing nucleoside triphosphate hydrolase protein [Linnemannia gamsii]
MMFENGEYQDVIDKINKIRSYGLNKMLTIPQIAILGDQSSGKSSVLEAITKLSFPRNIETCTRFATQVSLRRSEQAQMSAHIDNEPAFNELYHTQAAASNIHPIISEANRILCSSIEISEKVLEITISGPTLSPLTIIDLPGYINTTIDGQDKSIVETIRAINTRYIKDSRTIILAVVPANVDLNNIFVLGEAERYDPSNERTIPIVTKPDTVEPDLLPSLVHTILNKRKQMKLGYLVMKISTFKDIDISWDEARQRENDFFKSSSLWGQVPDARKGRASVEKFLGNLLYTHIKKELPFLKRDVLALIGECENEITNMGLPISNATTAKIKYFECIMKLKSSLTALLDGNYTFEYISNHKSDLAKQDFEVASNDNTPDNDDGDNDLAPPSLEGDHRFIRSSLQKLYQHFNQALNRDKYILPTKTITDLVLRYKGNELPGFISFTTFTWIYIETLVHWHDITKAHVNNMHHYLFKAITNYIMFAADPLLKDTLLLEFDKFYSSQTAKMNEAIENIFTDEGTPFTLNKYYYDNILKRRKARAEQEFQDLMAKFQSNTLLTNAPVTLAASDVNYNEQHAVEDLQEELQSYCKVARKRIVDIVLLQSIERYMIKQINLYFDMLVSVDDNTISAMLLEPPTTIARRQDLQDKVSVLRRSLLEL